MFIVPVAVLAFILPETPRWLVAHNRDDEAYEILARLNSHRESPATVDDMFSKLQKVVQVEDQSQEKGLGRIFKSDGRYHLYKRVSLRIDALQRSTAADVYLLLAAFSFSSNWAELMASFVCFSQSHGLFSPAMILDYSGTIFSTSIGFDAHSAALMSGFLFTWFFVASFIPWLLIDSIGRRPLVS